MSQQSSHHLLSVAIADSSVLHAAYMPFIRGGGLFVPTTDRYRLGEEVFVLLRLLDDEASIPLAGRVVWITPSGARGGKPAGIGVQFNDADNLVRQRIERHLAEAKGAFAEQPTYTM